MLSPHICSFVNSQLSLSPQIRSLTRHTFTIRTIQFTYTSYHFSPARNSVSSSCFRYLFISLLNGEQSVKTLAMASEQPEVFGGQKNFWLYSKTKGFDLTHPPTPTSPSIYPRIQLETTKGPIAIDPIKSALVIVDLQNFFLSPCLGRPPDGVAMKVMHELLKHAIPACRKANIPIVWLNWGLTEQDIEEMPPTIIKGSYADSNYGDTRTSSGLGSNIGPVELEDGSVVDGGRVLMRDTWNCESYPPLKEKRQPQDILINKNRLSGFWGGTGIEEALASRGIRTLFFAGANTDQCVGGSLQDAFTKGFDCLMLSDGCATSSPDFARQCIEYNCEGGWGFVLSCKNLADGVENM